MKNFLIEKRSNNSYLLTIKQYYTTNNTYKGNIRHFPPANKEWKDSVYSYDKNYLISLPVNKNITNKLIKSHFYLTNLKRIARSKRMRNLMIKRSSKKIFVSKPSIKHYNDKIIVNVHTYNRQKEFLMRKLYFYKRKYNSFRWWLKNFNLKKLPLKSKRLSNTPKKWIFLNIVRKYKNLERNTVPKRLPFYGIEYKNELDYLRYRTSSLHKKFTYFNNIFIYLFLSKTLSFFDVKLFIPIFKPKHENVFIKEILSNKPSKLIWLDNKLNIFSIVNRKEINRDLLTKILHEYTYSYNDILLVNNYITYYIEKRLINAGIINKSHLRNLYSWFKDKYYTLFIFKLFKEMHKIIFYLNALELNNLKFTKLLTNLKILINRIYNKKVELNVTNLKYPFLNSDLYTNITLDKAKKKVSFLRVLSSSITLSEIPLDIFYTERENLKLNKYKSISNCKSLSISNLSLTDNNISDKLDNVIEKLYPDHLVNNKPGTNTHTKDNLNKTIMILNTIKFKWVSGVRLQGAGRLTRRYTASRSAFKFKYRGNLKNKQLYIKDNKLRAMSTIMLRKSEKSNSQYTFMKSKRRIGSFGIKSWVSSY